MRFSLAILAALPLALATPTPVVLENIPGAVPSDAPPDGVKITGIKYAGTGCPAGSVASILSPDLSTLTLLYDSFYAQSGAGLNPSENRKNCQITASLTYPQGWQYSVFKADYRGYAYIQKGSTGTCKATYYFSGVSQQTSSTLTLKGPYDNNYLKTDEFGIETTVWAPCGQGASLNVNSEVRIVPIDQKNTGLLTVDSTDLKFTQVHYLQWQQCTP